VISGLGAVFFASTRDVNVSGIELWWTFFLFAFFIIIAAGGGVSMVNSIVRLGSNMVDMAGNTTEEAGRWWWRMAYNPFNGLFLPKFLTDDGLAARKRSFRDLLLVAASTAILMIAYFAISAIAPAQ